MKVLDLTHIISEGMPVYPGTKPPTLKPASTYGKDGFRETLLTMFSHTGTHMDAPAHLFAGKSTLDQFPVSQFVGRALVIECKELKEGESITMEHVSHYGEKAEKADFLLFHLGWDQRWGAEDYFNDYPCVEDEVIDFVLETGKKGIGFDVIGIDPVYDLELPRHKRLFQTNQIINIENLKNLGKCGDELFWFFALPLNQIDADGAPIRAVAFWD